MPVNKSSRLASWDELAPDSLALHGCGAGLRGSRAPSGFPSGGFALVSSGANPMLAYLLILRAN
jgi:hypothetical protein